MKLNKRTDYALRTLLFLATINGERLTTLNEISQKFHIVRDHLIKIVGTLSKQGYVTTLRGKGGGIKINPNTFKVSLYEIVMNFEPTFEVVDCEHLLCPVRGVCRLKRVLDKASNAFVEVLQQYTLSDILPQSITEQQDFRKKLDIPITTKND